MSNQSRKQRVLFAVGSMEAGGSERQLVEILKRLDRSRFDPQLYLIYRIGTLLSEIPADVAIHSFDATPHGTKIPLPGWMARQRVADMARVIREQQIDVVYNRTWMMTLVAANACRWANTPCLSVAVANPVQDFQQNAGRYRRLKFHLLRRAYKQSAKVAAVSEGVRQSLLPFFKLAPEHVVTLPNPVDADRVREWASAQGAQWDKERFHVTCNGRLSLEKGYDDLIAAVAQLVNQNRINNLLVHIFGTGLHEGELKQQIQYHQLSEFIKLEGFSTNPFPNLAQSQLFCLPSRYEGMPNALLEAMAVGVPVLATDCESGPREITRDGEFGHLVPPRNPGQLAEALADAMANYPKWQAKVADAREHVDRNYAPAVLLPKLEQLLIDLSRKTAE